MICLLTACKKPQDTINSSTGNETLTPTTPHDKKDPIANISLQSLNERRGVFYPINSETGFTGIAVDHYPTGQKKIQFSLDNGLINGPYKEWHKNGKNYIKCNYNKGTKDGEYVKWHESGELDEKCIYLNGKLNGPRESYYNGEISSISYYLNGELHGETKKYTRGLVRESKQYENGNLISTTKLYPNEQIASITTYKHDSGAQKVFFAPDGSPLQSSSESILTNKSVIFEIKGKNNFSIISRWILTFSNAGKILLKEIGSSTPALPQGYWSFEKPDIVIINLKNFLGKGTRSPYGNLLVGGRNKLDINDEGKFTLDAIRLDEESCSGDLIIK